MRRKRLNFWRKRGNLQFRRETSRLHDGTPWGEVLYIRIKGKACCYAIDRQDGTKLWFHAGTYFSKPTTISAAKEMRQYLHYVAENRS